jgi:hypothetical protein
MIIDDEDRYLGHHCLGRTAGTESLSDMTYKKMLLNAIQLVPAHLQDSPYHAPDIATLHVSHRTEQALDRDDFQFMRTIAEQVSSKLQALERLN